MDLADHADVLRKALSESQANSDKLVNILGSFDERLSALEADMRPTQVNRSGRGARVLYENLGLSPAFLCFSPYPCCVYELRHTGV